MNPALTCASCGTPWPCATSKEPRLLRGERAKHYVAENTRLLYLNVYAVTRHSGGPEEGGWYYNAGEPLASVPFRGLVLGAENPQPAGMDVYTMPPTCTDDDGHDCEYREQRDDPNNPAPVAPCTHEVRVAYDRAAVAAERDRLKCLFFDEASGDIYSVLGGQAVEVHLDWQQAAYWPATRPRYE